MSQKVKLQKIKIILFFFKFFVILDGMKIKISVILYLSISAALFSKEMTTHTFKTHNFRIQLPSYWEIIKDFEQSKGRPLVLAASKEENISLEIFTPKKHNLNLKLGFLQTLKNHHLWAENYTDIEQVAEFTSFNLKGYWARTMGYKHKKKIHGYLVYATDGIHLLVIHTYTNANLFPKNFLIMKNIFQGFALNRNYRSECCNECVSAALDRSNSSNASCSDFTETEECFTFFQNEPHSILNCK